MKFDVTKLPYIEVESQLRAFRDDITAIKRFDGRIVVEVTQA